MNKEIVTFEEGERVWARGFTGEKHYGTIHKNVLYPDVSEWYILYDDGEECAVLDETQVFKIEN